MNKTLRNTVMAGWIGIAGLWESGRAASIDAAEAKRKIVVHVYNYAQVDQKVMGRVGDIATRTFKRAGVEAVVIDQSEYEKQNAADGWWRLLYHLEVTILPREMGERMRLPGNILGVAPGFSNEHNRKRVYIFDHVAKELAREQNADQAQILGHAIAHEIGHLLLHTDQHSHNGIMKAKWNRKDVRGMTEGQLTFGSPEVAQIQAEVVRRNQQQAGS